MVGVGRGYGIQGGVGELMGWNGRVKGVVWEGLERVVR